MPWYKTWYKGTGPIAALLLFSTVSLWFGYRVYSSYHGSLLEFDNVQLYYTSSVTRDEATKLGNYLSKGQLIADNKVTIQIGKAGGTYELRIRLKLINGLDQDPEFVGWLKQTGLAVSQNVFNAAPVDVHLCDEYFRTVKVFVPLRPGIGFSVGKTELFFMSPVTRDEAVRLGKDLSKRSFFAESRSVVQIRMIDRQYEFRVIVKKGLDQDPEFVTGLKQLGFELSTEVFGGSPLEVHMCDDELRTIRVLIPLRLGTELSRGRIRLFYAPSVSKEEAETLGDYLFEERSLAAGTMCQVGKADRTYVFRVVVKKGSDQEPVFLKEITQFGVKLSKNVFKGAPVDIHLCDSQFVTVKVVTP